MSEKETIRSIRTLKKDGKLGMERSLIATILRELTSATALEKVGHILKDVEADEWNAPQASPVKPVKVAILSNFTCDAMANLLRPLLLLEGIWPEIYLANFNQYVYELMDEQSGLYRFAPDMTVCLLDEHIVLDELTDDWDIGELAHAAGKKAKQLQELIRKYETCCSGALVLNTIPLSLDTYQVIIDYKSKARLSTQWRQFNNELLQLSEVHKQVITLDLEVLLQEAGTTVLRDPRLAYYASMNMSEDALAAVAREAAKISRTVLGLSKKCLVLDLDNTLWGGIIGDDGLDGIQLGDMAPGKIFVDFQKKIKKLSRQGILLAVNSKNEEANVLEVLEKHADMQLRRDDFVIICANWHPKHENIKTIASVLNLGADSFVFLDDNPFERNMVREYVPVVTVHEMPEDPSAYVRALLSAGWFNTMELTQEDLKRTEKYKQEADREVFRNSASSVEDYLHGLGIEVKILPPDPFYLPRLTQLNMRTNQFNMTTRRYQEAQMIEMANSEDYMLIGFQSKDRFGDNGLIGSVIIEKVMEKDKESWWIRNFLMSCRVFSRGIETAVLQHILKLAVQGQVKEVYGEYIPTKKNVIVKDLYLNHGFEFFEQIEDREIFRHHLQLVGEPVRWITLHEKEEAVKS